MNGPSRICSGRLPITLCLGLALATASPLLAQPFGAWMTLTGASGYIEIPDSPALNPTTAFTVEAWVSVRVTTDGPACNSIVGKNAQEAWWVGICGTTLRSFLKGASSPHDGGTLDGNWNHIAVTFDGSNRRHYINGQMVAVFTETGTLTTSTSPMRIGSDTASPFTPTGAIDEVRLWNVARTTEEIRSTINVPIATEMPGLVSVWSLDATGNDALRSHHGSVVGSVGFLSSPVAPSCSATATSLCFDGRFAVNVSWTAPDGSTGVGHVVPGASANAGLFWFFNSDNWEVLVKEIDGCSLNTRRWIFSAATTNVSYRLTVVDVTHGVNKVYFNYPGPPAPAVTDTDALAVCP